MKRIISIILILTLFMVQLIPFAQAVDNVQTEYFDDGSYLVIGTPENIDKENSESAFSFLIKLFEAFRRLINLLLGKSEYKTKSAEKYVHYYDSNGVKLWSVYLSASFRYNSKFVECTDSSAEYYIYDNDWRMLYCNAEKSGATATASFKFRQYKLGVPLKVIEKSISLTCDINGKAS